MLQITTTFFEQALFKEFIFIVLVKDLLHGRPESLLPLEDSLLGDDVRSDFLVVASLEEEVGKLFDVVIGVVVDDNNTESQIDNKKTIVRVIMLCIISSQTTFATYLWSSVRSLLSTTNGGDPSSGK